MADVRTKIAIMGKAPSSRDCAPFDDDEWEIWTLSDLAATSQVPRWDRHFEMHPVSWFRDEPTRKPYYEWMCSVEDKPIYLMHGADPTIPMGVAFPHEELVAKFGSPEPYFTNSVSWMIAYAISCGPTDIGVYGVDMAQTPEYKAQRPSCEFFLGWARGAGINVHVPKQCDLLKTRFLYGLQHDGGAMFHKWQARTKELQQRLAQKQEKAQQFDREAAYLSGSLESQDYYAQYLSEQWTSD